MHPLKTSFPNDTTVFGIDICFNEEQPLNALSSIIVTDEGIVISFKFVQLFNTESPN